MWMGTHESASRTLRWAAEAYRIFRLATMPWPDNPEHRSTGYTDVSRTEFIGMNEARPPHFGDTAVAFMHAEPVGRQPNGPWPRIGL
jgi:hypothetical protein